MRSLKIRRTDILSRRIETSDNSSGREEHSDEFVVDRISKLPDSIISVILSFLPTKTAVTTSVLSKRWRFLWTTAFNLDFSHLDCDSSPRDAKKRSTRFAEYVNRVLLHQRSGYINSFALEWFSDFVIPSFVSAWLSTVMVRNVQDLSVHVDRCDPPIQMPLRNIFTGERLHSLDLMVSQTFISTAMAISLPRLEYLKLNSIRFQNAEAFQQLISGCPMLKEVNIHSKVLKNPFKCVVSLPHLKQFYFYLNYTSRVGRAGYRLDLEFEAPCLEFLLLNGPIYLISVHGSLTCLSEVYIYNQQHWDYSNGDTNYCNSIVVAIRALSYAETLVLPSHIIWALSCSAIRLCTKFVRLKKLSVSALRYYGSSVRDFIQCSDSLQVLNLSMESPVGPGELPNLPRWRNPEDIPICVANTLKRVSIFDYDGSSDEFAMIRYILKNGSVMEYMKISATNREVSLVQDVCALLRKSPTCTVEYQVKQ